jgi:putative endonuclease
MASKHLLGKKGEVLARDFLEKKTYRVITTNWKFSHLEVDIIAQFRNQIVFVEVKTRTTKSFDTSGELISRLKQRLLINAADIYVRMHRIELAARMDLIVIVWDGESEEYEIEHIEGAFSAWD